MTKGKYYYKLVLKAFGVKISQRCLAEATSELHLMKDAQELLGHYNAEHVESIDELKTEFWEIQNLRERIAEIEEQENGLQDGLYDAIGKRGDIVARVQDLEQQLEEEIMEYVDEREQQLEKRTGIFNEGKRIRKVYDGLKAKMDYFVNELGEEDPEYIATNQRLEECVGELGFLKGERDAIVSAITKIEHNIHDKEEELKKIREDSEFESFSNYTDVGGQNKMLTELRSERASLQSNLNKNVRYVGRFLFANRHDRQVNDCIKTNRELIHQANSLRKSIVLNHKLVDGRVALSEGG